jgi:hypothetical protein
VNIAKEHRPVASNLSISAKVSDSLNFNW